MMSKHDAEELASTARGIGARVIRGPVRYPGRNGGVEVGGVAIQGPLCELRDQDVLVIVAPLGREPQVVQTCGLCGTSYEEGECPACTAKHEEGERAAEEGLLFDEEFSALLSDG